jgi:hypothetical protein
METYGKEASRKAQKKIIGYSGKRPQENRSTRMEDNSS